MIASNVGLADALRDLQSLDSLYGLAASASSMMKATAGSGALLVVHLVLLRIATNIDGKPIEEPEFVEIRSVLRSLADLLDHSDVSTLNDVGKTFRQWAAPSTMQ